MTEQVKTNYITLDVREQKHSDIAQIVLICKTENWPHKRRRIEIRKTHEQIYKTAQLLVPGDLITVEETVYGNVKKDNGTCVRSIDAILVNFAQETL